MSSTQPSGFRAFLVIWAGQVVSILGTGMTAFALIFFAWRITSSATVLSLMAVSAFAPIVLFSPMAGTLVDRWSRKKVMILSDAGAATSTAAILLLFALNRLEVWHLYPAVAVAGIFGAFQFPAYSAAITLMIPKAHYVRASGMVSLAGSLSGVLSPILAGIMIATVGLFYIFAIDLATFAVAVTAIALVHIPQPAVTEEGKAGKGSFWKETAYGFRYIAARRGLLGLQLIFFGVNLVASFALVLLPAMLLSRTDNDVLVLSTVLSAGAVGQLVGGGVLTAWGGPKKRINGVLLGMIVASIVGITLLGLGQEVVLWSVAYFLGGFFLIVINGSSQGIWQSKVAPDVQGRVFSVRRLVAQVSAPIAMGAAGPLADGFFEPGMMAGGGLSKTFGSLINPGPGAGIALMFFIAGILGALVGIAGYLFREVRDIETLLPDHDAQVQPKTE